MLRCAGFLRARGGARRAGLAGAAGYHGDAFCGGGLGGRQRPHHGARMGEILGQQVVIENVGGAGGMTGSLARLKRRRRTATDSCSAIVGTPRRQPEPLQAAALQSMTDFAPVALLSTRAVGADRAQGLSGEHAARNSRLHQGEPGEAAVRLRRRGLGNAPRLRRCSTSALGVNATHIPYRGSGPAMQDLVGGRIDYQCESLPTALPQIQGNAVKADRAARPASGPRTCPELRPRRRRRRRRMSRPIGGTRCSCRRARPNRSSVASTRR